MSYSKRNEVKKTGLAFCRASGTEGATKHHLNLQERLITQTARKDGVVLKRVVKVRNHRVTLPELLRLAQGIDILYVISPKNLTRSYTTFNNMTSKLEAMGVEVRVAETKQDSVFDDLFNYLLEERMYWMRRELQLRTQKRKETC